jgi:two-component system chemotaxis response regulator CheY
MTQGRKRLLLVDDAATIRKLARAVLGSEYDYYEAENGDQGIALCRTEQPDLIVMDLNMPVKDGLAALAELKASADTRRVPVIILTSESEAGLRPRCEALGCVAFLRKPLDRVQLRNAVRSVLGAS